MNNKKIELTSLQDKFRQLYTQSENRRSDFIAREDFGRRGGFFRKKKRKQLLGLLGKSGGRSGKNTITFFWNEVTETVETALIDLQLFLAMADEKDIQKAITLEAVEPIVESLLYDPILQKVVPDLMRVNLAKLFIHMGFEYLSRMQDNQTHNFFDDKLNDAYLTSKNLADLLYAKIGTKSRYKTRIEKWERPRD